MNLRANKTILGKDLESEMKILIYTDLHCSYTSSILPLFSGDQTKFTTRLDMIIKTGKWISDIAKKKKVDCIINGGDTFDSIVVKAEELNAMSEFFKPFEKLDIPHYVLVGNHEKVNDNFNGSEILSGFKNITVYKDPTKINDVISVLPYMNAEEIKPKLLKKISNQLLVSHIDIQGSCLRDSYILDSGVNPEILAEYFNFVANGHLHTAEKLITSKNEVWNIGGVSSISFVDNQEYLPSITIYDSDMNTFERFNNPHSILFRKFEVGSIKDLLTELKHLLPDYNYVLTVKYKNYNLKLEFQNILTEQQNILAYKLISSYVSEAESKRLDIPEVTNLDVSEKFKDFLETVDLKFDKKEYLSLLKDLI